MWEHWKPYCEIFTRREEEQRRKEEGSQTLGGAAREKGVKKGVAKKKKLVRWSICCSSNRCLIIICRSLNIKTLKCRPLRVLSLARFIERPYTLLLDDRGSTYSIGSIDPSAFFSSPFLINAYYTPIVDFLSINSHCDWLTLLPPSILQIMLAHSEILLKRRFFNIILYHKNYFIIYRIFV